MKVIVACDSFKGTLSAVEACRCAARGVERAAPGADVALVPVSDGGEGFVDVMVTAAGGRLVPCTVRDPLGRPVESAFGLLADGETAVVEMARASGITLLGPEERDPLRASTYGTGELIRHALECGATRILVGLGGSATVDGGAGMAAALGVEFLDAAGRPVEQGGRGPGSVARIEMRGRDPRLESVRVEAACDVDNPLTGENGAARVYASQKGASPEAVELLERNLRHLAGIIRRDLGMDVENLPGAGAAGGLGAGMAAFAGASLRRGIDIVLDTLSFDRRVEDADLVITGEGSMDAQTLFGKGPAGVAARAAAHGCPVAAIAGNVRGNGEGFHERGITACFSIVPGTMSREEVFRRAPRLLERAAEEVTRIFLAGRKAKK